MPLAIRRTVWKSNGKAVLKERNYAGETPLFKAIEIETRTRCNSRCSFCAANVLTDQRPDVLMSEATWQLLLQQLTTANYQGSVRFFVNNEPLLDERTPRFIAEVKAQLPGAWTEVHTNGLKLNPKSGRALLEAGLDHLYINNYTTKGTMHKGVERFLAQVAPQFPDCEIVFHLRQLEEQLMNRAGTAPNAQQTQAPLPLPCVLPFEEIVVTADGRVTICCQDHYFDSAVGNVHQNSLSEIWFGESFSELRRQLQTGDRTGQALCSACDHPGYKREHLKGSRSFWHRIVGELWRP